MQAPIDPQVLQSPQSNKPVQREHHPLHHSYIWMSMVRALPYIILAILASVGPALSSLVEDLDVAGFGRLSLPITVGICLIVILVIAGIGIGCSAIAYRYKWYEFGLSEFSCCTGILNKRRSHIPYSKVQSVNEKMSLLQRLIGVVTVTIDTAGGESNSAVVVPYVEKSAAERIRQELFMRKNLLASGLTPEEVDIQMATLTAQSTQRGGAPIPPWEGQQSASAPVMPGTAPYAPVNPVNSGISTPSGCSTQSSVQSSIPLVTHTPQSSPMNGNVLDMPAGILDDMRGIFAGNEVSTGTVTCEYGLSNKELLLSALSSKTSFAFVLIGVVSALSTLLSGLIDARIIASSEVVYSAAWNMFGAQVSIFVLLGIVSVLVFLWVISVVSSCLSYAGFRSRRRGDRIEVERGLITHVFTGMDVDRVQSIHIHQTFFQRILGCCSVAYGRVGAMEQEGSDTNGITDAEKLVVHPFLPLSRVEEVIAGLTPEYQSLPKATKSVPKNALRRALIRRVIWQGLGFWLLVILACAWALLFVLVPTEMSQKFVGDMTLFESMLLVSGVSISLIIVIALFEAVNAVLWYKRAAMGWDHFGFTVVNGGFSVDTVTVPRTKIQVAEVRTNPLQRLSKVASVSVVTAAGVGSTKHRLIDISMQDADMWFAWARPHGNHLDSGMNGTESANDSRATV